MKKFILELFAGLCVALAFIGIIIPILPTTPFLLLAIYLYMRSSKKGVKMILKNKYLSPYVRSYFSKKGIPVNILIRTLVLLWVCLLVGIYIHKDNIYIILMLLVIGISVSIHLYSKKGKKQMPDKS
jgi:Uncharacterized protein conserved in bacteria